MMASGVRPPLVELVVLLASAGGLDPLSLVLRDLPDTFAAAVVVQQHLGAQSSVLPTILGRSTARAVGWAVDGRAVQPDRVVVCPPNRHMELRANGSWHLHRMHSPVERRFDVLLTSVASSYGPRALAVVLSGAGRDGAAGTAAMTRAGAIVIAQSQETADYPSMPRAAAQAGATPVLPLPEIGRAVAALVAGVPLLASTREKASAATGLPIKQSSVPAIAHHTDRIPSSLDHVMDSAASRAEAARLRAAELRRRRQELAAGLGTTAETVTAARRNAHESKRRAQLAHQAASRAAAHWGH
ncbi:chemotaxis protein CheB [Mycobacterium shigaense]|uniref:protein-glutamate methylesterase n=1 Tax=Mycobacterium shigaense TaxID=722731 RepID=A0A1Z4EEW1_9MYCO|nr:chemotaxis protein CheB [Mycobacterium shigaense]BAX91492.1 chemotaxis protein CheB [Mycobacterium shigaense]